MADRCNGSMNDASVLCLGGTSEHLVTLAQVACPPLRMMGLHIMCRALETNFTYHKNKLRSGWFTYPSIQGESQVWYTVPAKEVG